jgi:5-methylcytosine-specific restriction endonuclease McrA
VKTYAEQLKDPRWQRKRLEILSRADFTCEQCGSTDRTLHVHHKFYAKGALAWEYRNFQLKALCESCHQATTEMLQDIRAYLGFFGIGDLIKIAGLLVKMGDEADINEVPDEVRVERS